MKHMIHMMTMMRMMDGMTRMTPECPIICSSNHIDDSSGLFCPHAKGICRSLSECLFFSDFSDFLMQGPGQVQKNCSR